MNTECERFILPTASEIENTRVRIIAAMLNQAFISSCNYHEKYKKNLNKMHGKVDATKLDRETINSHDVSRFYEWANI